jgi:hypothetical protein
MANEPKQPLIGELSIDATELTFLVDLEPGARLRLRVAQPGIEAVIEEIKANQIVNGGADVVSETMYRELVLVEERMGQIDAKLPAARKLVEMMEETRALLDDQRQRLVSAVATVAEAQAKAFGDSDTLARYEKTRAYRSAIALKAARTRRRNQDDELDIEELIEPGPAEPIAAPVAAGVGTSPLIDARPASPAAAQPAANQ